VAERVPSGAVEARARPLRRRSDLWLAAAATISCNLIAYALVYRPTSKPKFFAQINNLLDGATTPRHRSVRRPRRRWQLPGGPGLC